MDKCLTESQIQKRNVCVLHMSLYASWLNLSLYLWLVIYKALSQGQTYLMQTTVIL